VRLGGSAVAQSFRRRLRNKVDGNPGVAQSKNAGCATKPAKANRCAGGFRESGDDGTFNVVPEPSSPLLLGTGLAGVVGAIRKKSMV
jgi:hypothetical protein